MFRPVVCAVYSIAFLALAVPAVYAGPQADIRALEQAWNAAYAANDLDKYFSYYSDDATLWFPDGRTDIPSYKKMWTEYIGSGGGIRAATLSDLHVRLSPRGDTAVASYLLHLKSQDPGKPVVAETYQETDVWFKLDGGWKVTHVHYSKAPDTH
jgi:ketosteroid isomerase-like protein